MKPTEAREIIKARYPVLFHRDMIRVSCKGNVLTMSGGAMAVQAMDRHVMQGLIPTKCKAMEKGEDRGKATYTYKF